MLGYAFITGCNDDASSVTGGDETSTGSSTTADDTTTTTNSTTDSVDETTGGPPETCVDGVRNQDESDVDCGGQACSPCDVGQACNEAGDCVSLVCSGNTCQAPACTDGAKNGDETDVDCGGSCAPCAPNQGCSVPEDCTSGICENEVCVPASCRDGVLNGTETDLDCGGPSCPGCPEGGACTEHGDCATAFCSDDVCVAVECVNNGQCNHLAGTCMVGQCNQQTNTCQAVPGFQGQQCNDGDLCTYSTCSGGLCSGPPVDCSFFDGECSAGACEAGVGCVAQPLNDGASCFIWDDWCVENTICIDGQCGGGDVVDCSHFDNQCQVGSCDPWSGSCFIELVPDGTPCDDAFACSSSGSCFSGACVPDEVVPHWTETFANNDAGWTLGPQWEIGPAQASNCWWGFQDPAQDHTQAGDNGVAGVVIGGCAGDTPHPFYCLTSPVIDTSGIEGPLLIEYYRHLHSDYSPFMHNTVDVFDGTSWVTVWASDFPDIDDADWTRIVHEASNYKNASFQVRFCYDIGAFGVFEAAGWNLDDVSLLTCP